MAVTGFATLIKLQKTRVDDQRTVLVAAQNALDAVDARIAEVEIAKAREQAAADSGEARMTYGAFAASMVAQGRALAKEREAAAQAVTIAQNRLAELFEEQKRYETAEAHRLSDLRREEARRETLALDEMGAVAHERKRQDS